MKPEVLSRIVDMNGLRLSLVFCNTKRKVDEVAMELQARGYLAEGSARRHDPGPAGPGHGQVPKERAGDPRGD